MSLALAACHDAPGPPPWGFDRQPEQHYRLEALDDTDVGGEPARIQRLAEFRLVVDRASSGHEIALYLERYYLRVDGAPGGTTEVLISGDGFRTSGTPEGDVEIGADEVGPGGASPRTLLARPIAGFIVDSDGVVQGRPWTSLDPLLAGVHVLDWVLLGFPVLAAEGRSAWDGDRALPAIGQYEFGIQLPIRYERQADAASGPGLHIAASGVAQRSDLEVRAGFSGDASFDYVGEVDLDPAERVTESRAELRVQFVDSRDGGIIRSRHRVRLSCTDCAVAPPPAVNPPAEPSDSESG